MRLDNLRFLVRQLTQRDLTLGLMTTQQVVIEDYNGTGYLHAQDCHVLADDSTSFVGTLLGFAGQYLILERCPICVEGLKVLDQQLTVLEQLMQVEENTRDLHSYLSQGAHRRTAARSPNPSDGALYTTAWYTHQRLRSHVQVLRTVLSFELLPGWAATIETAIRGADRKLQQMADDADADDADTNLGPLEVVLLLRGQDGQYASSSACRSTRHLTPLGELTTSEHAPPLPVYVMRRDLDEVVNTHFVILGDADSCASDPILQVKVAQTLLPVSSCTTETLRAIWATAAGILA